MSVESIPRLKFHPVKGAFQSVKLGKVDFKNIKLGFSDPYLYKGVIKSCSSSSL